MTTYNDCKSGAVIATSIAPVNIENQKNAISTWIEAGFDVVSLNCKEEINLIKEYFPDIKFVTVNRNARLKYGKPYVFFDDVMKYLQEAGYSICGIVNSDIYFKNIGENFKEFVIKEAKGAFVFGHRVDMQSIDSLDGTWCEGHDYFFFDRSFSYIYPEENFCLGQPAWDYWVVFIPALRSLRVKKIVNPIAYHIKHNQTWNYEVDLHYKRLMLNKYMEDPEYIKNYSSPGHKRIQNLVEGYPERILYFKYEKQYKVLIVYNGDCSLETPTFKSIMKQNYKNLRITTGNRSTFDLDSITEDAVCFVNDGVVLNDDYVGLMLNELDGNDIVLCCVGLESVNGFTKKDINTFDLTSMQIDMTKIIDECILYNTEFLKGFTSGIGSLNDCRKGFVRLGLVEIEYSEYIRKRVGLCKGEQLYIYGAGGHTENLLNKLDFTGLNLCGIIDKNLKLQGTYICGYRVYHTSDIKNLNIDKLLISSLSYENEMYEELLSVFEPKKLIRIYFN